MTRAFNAAYRLTAALIPISRDAILIASRFSMPPLLYHDLTRMSSISLHKITLASAVAQR